MKHTWLTAPILFFILLLSLLGVWAILEPATLIRNFDHNGCSPFELATLPFYFALIPAIWWFCPFDGPLWRRRLLCLSVSIVAAMAIVKELDLHAALLNMLYPDYVDSFGRLVSGRLYKPNGMVLTGTPFKMRVLLNGETPLGMRTIIVAYFALFFGLFFAGFAYLFTTWLKGVFRLVPHCWSIGCFGLSGLMVQVADRLPSWSHHQYGFGKHSASNVTSLTSLMTVLEEGGEMLIPIFALLAIYQAYKRKEQTK